MDEMIRQAERDAREQKRIQRRAGVLKKDRKTQSEPDFELEF